MKSSPNLANALLMALLVPALEAQEKPREYSSASTNDLHLRQSPGAWTTPPTNWDYGLGDGHISKLQPYPDAKKGDRSPFDLWRYGGKAGSSFATPSLPMPWEKWLAYNLERKPKLMAEVRVYMNSRYDFSGKTIPGVVMSGGHKPVMAGPVARLPKGVADWDALGQLSAEEIKRRDLFPFKPLAHPLQTTAHMLFPASWTKAHPEHERIDVDLDIPDEYLPEFPPPLFLTRHLLLPDVAGNKLFQSYGNMDGNPHVGLLFMIPGVDETVRVNGAVTIVDKAELERLRVEMSLHNPDDNARHLQGILIEVEEAYGHCPRAFKFSQLWNTEQIQAHQANRPVSNRPYES